MSFLYKEEAIMAEKMLTYKGKPLVRQGDTIYYGNSEEKYIVKIQINSSKDVGGIKVAEKVTVQLILSDHELKMKDRIVKSSDKVGLYAAMDIGSIWLERALKG